MKTYAPDYYKKFHCIADRCKHSCCIGWDVYLDEDTLEKYARMEGELGDEIRTALCQKEDGVCFEMCEGGRCPFLNKRGLCRIILEKGEDSISEICREHPRFYNCFSDRVEVGLGLSCEEAARIILSETDVPPLTVIEEDDEPEEELWEEEAFVLEKRAQLFALLQDRSRPLTRRTADILAESGAMLHQKRGAEWAECLRSLERLDPAWEDALDLLAHTDRDLPLSIPDTAFENLLHYFLYRHCSPATDEADLSARVAFSCLSLLIIRRLCSAKVAECGTCSFDDLCDFARMYSAEIEYSEENTQRLIDLFY